MAEPNLSPRCPDCDTPDAAVSRRQFLRVSAAAALAEVMP